MTLPNFPSQLTPIIQTGYLEHEFQDAIQSVLAFRSGAQVKPYPNRIGTTITDTRAGLKAPVTTPLSNSSSNFDNNLTPSTFSVEQWTFTLNQYADTIDLNVRTAGLGIASQFVQNAKVTGVQSSQSLERIAAQTLYNAAFSGHTYLQNSVANTTTVYVDDIRGFQTFPVNGVQTTLSSQNTLSVTIGNSVYLVSGATANTVNTSVSPYGTSGYLTLTSNVSVSDGGANSSVVATNATTVIRPNARTNSNLLVSGDTLSQANLLDAMAVLEKNAAPKINALYNCYLDPVSMRQLLSDSDFRQLFQGATTKDPVFRNAFLHEGLGIRFIKTTEAPVFINGAGLTIRNPILVAADALVECRYEGMDVDMPNDVVHEVTKDGITMTIRSPMDRLGQMIAQSWYSIIAFACPTDITTTSSIVPTATNAAFKRMVLLQHVG